MYHIKTLINIYIWAKMTLIIDKVLYYGPNENVIEYGTSVLNCYNK